MSIPQQCYVLTWIKSNLVAQYCAKCLENCNNKIQCTCIWFPKLWIPSLLPPPSLSHSPSSLPHSLSLSLSPTTQLTVSPASSAVASQRSAAGWPRAPSARAHTTPAPAGRHQSQTPPAARGSPTEA